MSPLPILATIITLVLAVRLTRRAIEQRRRPIPIRTRRAAPKKR